MKPRSLTVTAQRFAHIVRDVIIEIHTRRSRAVLLMVAVAMATGALVASLGISQVTARQVDADLAASALDTVTVSVARLPEDGSSPFPADTQDRVLGLGYVDSAGLRLDLSGDNLTAIKRGTDPNGAAVDVDVAAVTSGYVDATGGSLSTTQGWLLDGNERIVFTGRAAAEKLGFPATRNPTGLAVLIAGENYQLVGTLTSGDTDLDNTLVIPYAQAVGLGEREDRTYLHIDVASGAGAPVSHVVAQALNPNDPELYDVSTVVDFSNLRSGVSTQMDKFIAWIGSFLLALTVLLIANAMVVSVTARTAEIGVRRTFGTPKSTVAGLFLTEGAIIGLLGGLTGSAIATVVIVLISLMSGWSASFAPVLMVYGPIVGLLAGIVSSAYPALRAANIAPALAVRAD